jgi:hypothetical protein
VEMQHGIPKTVEEDVGRPDDDLEKRKENARGLG